MRSAEQSALAIKQRFVHLLAIRQCIASLGALKGRSVVSGFAVLIRGFALFIGGGGIHGGFR